MEQRPPDPSSGERVSPQRVNVDVLLSQRVQVQGESERFPTMAAG